MRPLYPAWFLLGGVCLACVGESGAPRGGARASLDDAVLSPELETCVTDAAGRLHGATLDDPAHARYLECGGEGTAPCDASFDDAIASAVWSLASSFDEDEYGFAAASRGLGVRRSQGQLTDRYAASADLYERIAILSALRRVTVFVPEMLPVECYRRIGELPAIEATLLLEAHLVVPVDDPGAADDVRLLAMNPAKLPGVRYAATAALGHPETWRELLDVTAAWEAEGELGYGAATRLGPALGRCGPACLDAMQRLATSGHVQRRQAAYLAASRLDTAARDALEARLAATGVTASTVPLEERLMFERAFGGGS